MSNYIVDKFNDKEKEIDEYLDCNLAEARPRNFNHIQFIGPKRDRKIKIASKKVELIKKVSKLPFIVETDGTLILSMAGLTT